MSAKQEERVEVSDALFIQAIQHLRVGGPRNIALAQSLEEDAIRSGAPQPKEREEFDRIENARQLLDRVGGVAGNGPDELGVLACAEALISIAEDVREIRACPFCGEVDSHRFSCQRLRRDSLSATTQKPDEEPDQLHDLKFGARTYTPEQVEIIREAVARRPDEELQADSKPVQNLESEGDWPVVKITSMGRAVPSSAYIEADARVVIPKGTERYYPASHPLVLTPAEALLLVKARDDDELNVAEFDAAGELCNRLVEAAKEGSPS